MADAPRHSEPQRQVGWFSDHYGMHAHWWEAPGVETDPIFDGTIAKHTAACRPLYVEEDQ